MHGIASARARKIKADAALVNLGYGLGYGLVAVGGGFLLTGAVGIKASPTSVSMSVRF